MNAIPDGFQEGDRVALIFTNDEYTNLRPSDEGTVTGGSTGSYAQLWVKWDNGSSLALLPGKDRYKKVQP